MNIKNKKCWRPESETRSQSQQTNDTESGQTAARLTSGLYFFWSARRQKNCFCYSTIKERPVALNQICNLLSTACPVWNQSSNASLSTVLNKSTKLTTAVAVSFNKSQSAAGNCCLLSEIQINQGISTQGTHCGATGGATAADITSRYHELYPRLARKLARQDQEIEIGQRPPHAKQAWSC